MRNIIGSGGRNKSLFLQICQLLHVQILPYLPKLKEALSLDHHKIKHVIHFGVHSSSSRNKILGLHIIL